MVTKKNPYLYKNANSFYNFVSLLRDSQQTPVFSHKFSQYFIFYFLIFFIILIYATILFNSTVQYLLFFAALQNLLTCRRAPLIRKDSSCVHFIAVPASVRTLLYACSSGLLYTQEELLFWIFCYVLLLHSIPGSILYWCFIWNHIFTWFRLPTQAQIFTYGAVPYSLLL